MEITKEITKITPISQTLSNCSTLNILFLQNTEKVTQNLIISDMLDQIKSYFELDLGFYPSIDRFQTDMVRRVFGESTEIGLPDIIKHTDTIFEIIKRTIGKCYSYLPIDGDINIFILPMSDPDASTDLDGVNAFVVGKHAIYILLNPMIDNWEVSLEYTLAHEYAHLISAVHFEWDTIMAGIVFEGLAEHFRETLFQGNPAKYSIALPKETALKEFRKIPLSDLEAPNDEEHYDLYISYFFGTKELPNWYGYSLGYWLIDIILESKKMTLAQLFNTSPKEVLKLLN